MLQIHNLTATGANKPIFKGLSLGIKADEAQKLVGILRERSVGQ